MSEPLIVIAAAARQLTRPHICAHRRIIRDGGREITTIHRTRMPSLLDQLRVAFRPGTGDEDGGTGQSADPPAPINLDALDALAAIEASARILCRGHALRAGPSPETAIGALAAAASHLTAPDQDALATAMQGWRTLARAATGWDEPPRDLRDRCPHCATRALRVLPDASAAWCRACGAAWDSATVGVLAGMLTAGN